MQSKNEKKHVIDFLFPIALLFVFAASSFVVILLAANVYSKTTAASQEHYETRTPLSYVAEKIRQADEGGGVAVGDFNGLDALILTQKYGGQKFITYIYAYEGELMELFIQDGVKASPASGTGIMEVEAFHVGETRPGIFQFSCTSAEGSTLTSYVSVTSQGGAADEF
ncbi:MAG: DUF4860 domain-containing protein [Hespellia sp.]|nr:DUF4860 domain-containing protein [Hespellia sp.]